MIAALRQWWHDWCAFWRLLRDIEQHDPRLR